MSIIWSKRINSAGQILEALQQGFSAIDFSLTELTNSSSEELKLIKSLLAQTNLRVASFSNLLPDDVTVTSSGFNDYVWLLYVKKTLEQIVPFGGDHDQIISWDNGAARALPWESGVLEAKEQFYRFLHASCQAALINQQTIALAPASSHASNYLNTAQQMLEFIALVDMPNLKISILDRYWNSTHTKETELSDYAAAISQVTLTASLQLNKAQKDQQHELLKQLQRAGYKGIITLDGNFTKQDLKQVKSHFEA